MPKKKSTSWGEVAEWYDDHLKNDDTYHSQVILPNITRLVDPKLDDKILDIACGNGFFTKAFALAGADSIGIDVSGELIELAQKNSPDKATFRIGTANNLKFLPDESINKIINILAIQNIEQVKEMFTEAKRVLCNNGKMFIVMNHPTFRIPKKSSWQWDDKSSTQYRRIDAYMSETKEEIAMHPGQNDSPTTVSFHRPLQYYTKLANKEGFVITRLEEWISHKTSSPGERQKEENRIRKEIPLFLFLELRKDN